MNNLLCSIKNDEKSELKIKDIKYFKEINFYHNISAKVREEIDSILYIRADIFIGEMSLIKTDKMVSNEGVVSTGYKLRVELLINEFFKYSIKLNNSSVGIIRNNIIKIVYITIPEEKNGISIEELYRRKKLSVKGYLEDMYCDRFQSEVDCNLTILINCNIN